MNINYMQNIKTDTIGKQIKYYEEINSTHIYAKENIKSLEEGTVILADNQTAGCGTKGRKWHTGKGLNIAMTIILKPNCKIEKIKSLTVDIANIIKNVVKELYNYDLKIKEPNDLLLNNKKICGILTESSTIGEKINHIILSIGFNVNEIDFSEELSDIATSLKKEYTKDFDREEIITSILKNIDEYLKYLTC